MTNTKREIERYFREILDLEVIVELWQPARRLPLYLRDGYTFYEMNILGHPCLLMADKAGEGKSAAMVRKQLEAVEPKWDGQFIIYMREQVTSHQRRNLIEHKIPFIVPGNQLYLPMLGVDLREYYRQLRMRPPAMSPATQALILHILLDPNKNALYVPGHTGEKLGYSKMTMTRAFDELEAEQLVNVSKKGRERWLELPSGRKELWEKSLPILKTPVKRQERIRRVDHPYLGIATGETALARYSMLAEPRMPQVAMSTAQWHELKRQNVRKGVYAGDPDAVEVQIWNYDPTLLANEDVVDRLSLYLSLRDTKDERVQTALAEMMEGVMW
jgi:DNA-binding MarR family transcriptional regulator